MQAAATAPVAGQVVVGVALRSALPVHVIDGTEGCGVTVTTTGAVWFTCSVPRATVGGVTVKVPGVPAAAEADGGASPEGQRPLAAPITLGAKPRRRCRSCRLEARTHVPPLPGQTRRETLSDSAPPRLRRHRNRDRLGRCEVAPTSTEPKFKRTEDTVTWPTGGGPSVDVVMCSTAASVTAVVELPLQPTTVSVPMSPRQLAWSNRPNLLEHVM